MSVDAWGWADGGAEESNVARGHCTTNSEDASHAQVKGRHVSNSTGGQAMHVTGRIPIARSACKPTAADAGQTWTLMLASALNLVRIASS